MCRDHVNDSRKHEYRADEMQLAAYAVAVLGQIEWVKFVESFVLLIHQEFDPSASTLRNRLRVS